MTQPQNNPSTNSNRNIGGSALLSIICMLAAAGVGMGGAYVDQHNATEVYPVLAVSLVGAFLLGIVRPRHVWLWALIIAAFIPFSPFAAAALHMRLASPGSWAILGVVLIPAMIGAYSGWGLRKAAGTMQ